MGHSMHNDQSRRIVRLLQRIVQNNTASEMAGGLKIRDESVPSGHSEAQTPFKNTHGQLRASNQAHVLVLGSHSHRENTKTQPDGHNRTKSFIGINLRLQSVLPISHQGFQRKLLILN